MYERVYERPSIKLGNDNWMWRKYYYVYKQKFQNDKEIMTKKTQAKNFSFFFLWNDCNVVN